MNKYLKIILIIVGVTLLLGINWALYSGIVLGIPDEVKDALLSNEKVRVENWKDKENYSFFPVEGDPIAGLILYPEGNLDARLYAPLAQMVAREGVQITILARRYERSYDFSAESLRMDEVIAAYPAIENWVVGGLTWSSVLPVNFAIQHAEKVDAVILLASRLDEATSLAETDFPVLYIYGTRDDENEDLLNWQAPFLPPQTIFGKIDGGNRLQYGYTGPMARDVAADISTEEQQRAAADFMIEFIKNLR